MLSRYPTVCTITGVAALALTWTSVQAQKPTAAPSIDFVRDIQPILQTHCYECHGREKQKHGLRLDLRTVAMKGGETGPAVIPGNSEQSLMVRRLLGLDGEDQMPKDKDPLARAQIELIRAWIDQGAVWPESADAPATASQAETEQSRHWAYRAPVRPALPTVRNANWMRTPIDQFILARLEHEGLAPSSEAPLGFRHRLRKWNKSARRPRRMAPAPRTRVSSIACSRHRIMESVGRAPGSIWRAMPTRTGMRRICRESCGSTATG